MRNKFRSIEVSGKLYGYSIGTNGNSVELRICENKQIIHREVYEDVEDLRITPIKVSDLIMNKVI